MLNTHATTGRGFPEVLDTVHDDRRLATMVKAMAREIERLHEDNIQLRAAVGIYRELANRSGAKFAAAG
jgi:hypothetical protein